MTVPAGQLIPGDLSPHALGRGQGARPDGLLNLKGLHVTIIKDIIETLFVRLVEQGALILTGSGTGNLGRGVVDLI